MCLGGHLALRCAFDSRVQATFCYFATDVHSATLGKGKKDDTVKRIKAGDMTGKGEVTMVFGKQVSCVVCSSLLFRHPVKRIIMPRMGERRGRAGLVSTSCRLGGFHVNEIGDYGAKGLRSPTLVTDFHAIVVSLGRLLSPLSCQLACGETCP
jgi:hypothetical protein